jgi:uncharacterized membrane protein HdeD (DUF308 family)
MDDRAMELVNKGLPWRRDVSWTVIAIEAAALIGIGAYILIDTDGASEIFLQLVGVVLLVTSVLLGLASMRNSESGLGFFDAFRAGIGVTAGAIATVSWWSDYIENHAVRMILGWGLIAYTLLHLVGMVAVRGRSGLRVSTLVVVALTMVLGILLLTGSDTSSTSRLNTLGVILIIFGVLLAALAYYLYSRGEDHAAVGTGAVA